MCVAYRPRISSLLQPPASVRAPTLFVSAPPSEGLGSFSCAFLAMCGPALGCVGEHLTGVRFSYCYNFTRVGGGTYNVQSLCGHYGRSGVEGRQLTFLACLSNRRAPSKSLCSRSPSGKSSLTVTPEGGSRVSQPSLGSRTPWRTCYRSCQALLLLLLPKHLT